MKLAVLATVWGMVDATMSQPHPTSGVWVDGASRVVHWPGTGAVIAASDAWWVAASERQFVVVSLTSRPLSSPDLHEVDEVMASAGEGEVWCALAYVR